jgi:hypothetical protein
MDLSGSKQVKYRLNFSHPWSDFLYTAQVPRDRYDEFYSKFGTVMHSETTPESTKASAFIWIDKNGKLPVLADPKN